MRSVVDEGTAHGGARQAEAAAAARPAPRTRAKDAWFVGYTPDLLAAVWVGFDDGKTLGKGEAGGKTAVPIWTEFMAKALAAGRRRTSRSRRGVVVQRIDKASGLLAAPGQDGDTLDEVFLEGTAPTVQAPVAGEESSADKLLLQ